MKKPRTIRIALCGPGDVGKEIELAQQVIAEWNQRNFDALNCGLKAYHWTTDMVPSMEGRGQALIDREMIDLCDVLIAIFWKRLGTPTGLHESGTVEEIHRAMAREKDVLIYFSDAEDPNASVDEEQERRLVAFRQKAMASGLPWRFSGKRQFKELFSDHIHKKVLQLMGRTTAANKSGTKRPSKVTQKAEGSNNLQIAGDGNVVNLKTPRTPKISVTPPVGSLSPSEQHQIQEWIEELSILIETVEKKTVAEAKSSLWSRLKNKFKVSKYELIESAQMGEVRNWYRITKAKLEGKSKRKAPKVFQHSKFTAIKSAMRGMGRTNEDYYPEIAQRLKLRPFSSLTELSVKNLGKVYELVRRDLKKFT